MLSDNLEVFSLFYGASLPESPDILSIVGPFPELFVSVNRTFRYERGPVYSTSSINRICPYAYEKSSLGPCPEHWSSVNGTHFYGKGLRCFAPLLYVLKLCCDNCHVETFFSKLNCA